MVCIAWLGIRLCPPSICDVQVGSLERALLQERLVVCITVPVLQESDCRKEYLSTKESLRSWC